MNIYIYDLEVFKYDWLAVFRNVDDKYGNHIVIHNNNYQLKEFINQNNILCGFNNKGYDDWILMTMLNGGNNKKVKEHNDYIIVERNEPWTYPFIQFQKRPFKSFDLRDDLPDNLSLKAIEGNIKANIRESKIDFNINHKLNDEELKEVIQYCCTDVDNTLKLYQARENYIKSKKTLAKIKGVDPIEYIPLTNAKMTAKFMDAQAKSFDDEFIYNLPECVDVGKYQEVMKFFLNPVEYSIQKIEERKKNETRPIKIKSLNRKIEKIKEDGQYKTSLEIDIAGVPHVYGWGGIHGARKNFVIYEDKDYTIVDIDVGSYYPSMCLEFGFVSRAITNSSLYREVYTTRINAKHTGDSETADALKLVLNTFYGAMKNKYIDLYDPHMANQICITGQLLLTDLIDKLENVPSFELIQSNTDGIILRYHNNDEKKIEKVVKDWELKTKLNMEYTIIHSYIAKDVNNYIIQQGATYLIDSEGNRTYTKEDKYKISTKGGYVSLYKGGDFKNNSLVVVHKAIVNYFVNQVPVEETILQDNNIEDFQIIAKTGLSYEGTYHKVNGKKVEVQRVNRVYASRNKNYGTIYKRKNGKDVVDNITSSEDERIDKIASLPEHCIIDNEFKLTIDDVDKDFYIALAYKRVSDYIGNIQPIKKGDKKMANVKTESSVAQTNTLNIHQKLLLARAKFLASPVKKSGVNRFAEFKYFELSDIVPVATSIFSDVGLLFLVSYDKEQAIGMLYNVDSPDQCLMFQSPMRELDYSKVKGMNAVQGLGGEETYQRRYLYMMCLDIVEADTFDATSSKDDGVAKAPKEDVEKVSSTKSKKPVTPIERENIKTNLINSEGKAEELQIKSIKEGLKQLRAKDEKYESYITETIKNIKNGISKEEAEKLLIEISDKVEE